MTSVSTCILPRSLFRSTTAANQSNMRSRPSLLDLRMAITISYAPRYKRASTREIISSTTCNCITYLSRVQSSANVNESGLFCAETLCRFRREIFSTDSWLAKGLVPRTNVSEYKSLLSREMNWVWRSFPKQNWLPFLCRSSFASESSCRATRAIAHKLIYAALLHLQYKG